MKLVAGLTACALLGACATVQTPGDEYGERVVGADGACDADAAAQLVGQPVTQALGGRALELTGARLFRWAPPDSALTMDYRPDRVTVHYDREMRVERVVCG